MRYQRHMTTPGIGAFTSALRFIAIFKHFRFLMPDRLRYCCFICTNLVCYSLF